MNEATLPQPRHTARGSILARGLSIDAHSLQAPIGHHRLGSPVNALAARARAKAFISLLVFSLLAGCGVWSSAAADRRWTGDGFSNAWSDPDNWLPVGPPQDGETLIFGNNGSRRSNNNDIVGLRAQSIVFTGSAGGYTLSGNPVLLHSDVTAAHTTGYNNVRLGVEFIPGGGTFGIASGGRLEISGSVTLANRANLGIYTLGTNLTISGPILGDGGLEKLGSHALFLAGTAANTYSGPTYIHEGAVYLAKPSGARAISTQVSIGERELGRCSLADLQGGQYPSTMSVYIGPTARWALTNGATVSSLTLDNGDIEGEGLLNLFCNVTNHGASRIQSSLYLGDQSRIFYSDHGGGAFAQIDVLGHILGPSGGSSPPGIIKEGPGRLVLKSQNTYSGPTLINDGAVSAEHPQALGTATGETRVREWAALEMGRYFPTNPITFTEPVVLEGGHLAGYGYSELILTGPFRLSADSTASGPENARLDLRTAIDGPGGLKLRGGLVRFSGAAPNTFSGPIVIEPAYLPPAAILELAKPNNVVAVPTTVTLQGFRTNIAVLRQFQDNGASAITLLDGGVWHLNGYAALPDSLRFFGGGVVDTGYNGVSGILNFSGLTVNTQLQVLPKPYTPSNYTARIIGRINSFAATNDLHIPEGVTLDIGAQVLAPVLQKRGPGKLVLGGNNRLVGNIYAQDGELAATADHALGGHTTVSDGATLWLESVFNFGSLTLQGRGFQGNGALAVHGIALFSSNIILSASATLQSAAPDSYLAVIGSIGGAGSVTKEGAGVLAFGGSLPNTFTGEMLVNAGTLELGKDNFLPSVPGDLVVGSGRPGVPGARVVYSGHDQVWNRITVNRDSLLDLNGYEEYSGDVTLNDGGDITTGKGLLYLGEGVNLLVKPGTPSESSEIAGHLSLGGGPHQFRVAPGGRPPGYDLLLTARISQPQFPADIVKDGPGGILMNGSNSFSGTLTINEGIIYAGHSFAFGLATGGTYVNGNSSLVLDGNVWVRDETLTLNSIHPSAFASTSFSNAWTGNITLQRDTSIRVTSGSLSLMGFFDCCAGVISGPGGITKEGDGTLYITGFFPNTYAGPTVINNGKLEAWRIVSPALPGDVVVAGTNTMLRTGRAQASTALSSGARVTVNRGAQWIIQSTSSETLRALLGDGLISLAEGLGASATLAINNTNSCEFSGAVRGFGALEKRGPASFQLSGQSPFYGGPMTVFQGALRVDGHFSGSPVTVKEGAQLRGDGKVGNITALEPDSVVQIDASFTDHPDRQGGDLEASYLTLGPGGVLGFDLAGPAPTGGNDLLIAHGPVNLGGARLSVQFRYPPRDGDVITLLRNNSPIPTTGLFNGWPEGVTRKAGDTTVRATYLGGDGNDFTLTVTNLALASSTYRLAEGNGNQTVEPDECNLMFVSLQNRRTGALTITNAFLRTLTPGAVVTAARTTYHAIPASAVRENNTPFQFRTEPSLPCGRPVELELILGVAGEGEFAVAFEVAAGEGPDCGHPTGPCESCHTVSGQFTTNAPTLVRFHNFVGGPSLCFPAKRCPETNAYSNNIAVPYLTHVFTNATTNELCVTAQLHPGCLDALTNALGAVAYLGTNDYHDPCANYLGDTGADGRQPFSFRVPPRTNFLILVSARATNVSCANYRLELFGLPCPPPALHIAKDAAPEKILLSWSTSYPEFGLQTSAALGSQPTNRFNAVTNRVVIGGRYTVTNGASATQQWFRLSK